MSQETQKLNPKVTQNPLIGVFTVENFEATQLHIVYDINRMVLKISIINGELNLCNEPKEIYLLRIQRNGGEWISKKLIKF